MAKRSPKKSRQTIDWKKVIAQMDIDIPKITEGEFLEGLMQTSPDDPDVQEAYLAYRKKLL